MAKASASPVQRADNEGWATAVKGWGLFAGVAFAAATIAYLVEATGLIGSAPAYAATAAGQLHWYRFPVREDRRRQPRRARGGRLESTSR